MGNVRWAFPLSNISLVMLGLLFLSGVMVAQRTLNPQPSEGVSVGSNPTGGTMTIVYEVLEDDPFAGIIEMWNYKADILLGCPPSRYGMYWAKKTIYNADVNDLINLLNRSNVSRVMVQPF